MKLFESAPSNLCPLDDKTPFVFRQVMHNGRVYDVEQVTHTHRICCFSWVTHENVGILNSRATQSMPSRDFPFLGNPEKIEREKGLVALAVLNEKVTHSVLSKTHALMQFILLRGAETDLTYVMVGKSSNNRKADWRSVEQRYFYYYQNSFDKEGQMISFYQITGIVRAALSNYEEKANTSDGPLDSTFGFERCRELRSSF